MANIDIIVKALKVKSEAVIVTPKGCSSTCRSVKTRPVDQKALFDFLDEKTNRL